MSEEHDKMAQSLAKRFRTKYKRKGHDIVTGKRIIEVTVSDQEIKETIKQLRNSRTQKKRFVATPSEKVSEAKKLARGTGVGVMGARGKIHKRSRKRT